MDESANVPLPILVAAATRASYDMFVRTSGFKQGETRHIGTADDIKGYKDKVMLMLDYPVAAGQFLYYAQTHNIRVVRVRREA